MTRFSLGNTKASKLTALQVLEIREKYAAGTHTQAALSRQYNVGINTIRNILSGVTWQQVPAVVPEAQRNYEIGQSERLFDELMQSDVPGVPMPPDLAKKIEADLERTSENANTELGLSSGDPIEAFLKRRHNEQSNPQGHQEGPSTQEAPSAEDTREGPEVAGEGAGGGGHSRAADASKEEVK